MASPSCQVQLYYGPTSHFSLMQHIYRDLVSNPTAQPEPSSGVEEASAGLDLFSFRRIFFGTPDNHEPGKTTGVGDAPLMFLPYDLAKMLLSRFLSSLYHMTPYRPKAYYQSCLERIYDPSPAAHPDTLTHATILIFIATASLGTEYFAWGEILYDRVKASMAAFDEVVNLQTIQISVLMIRRPNSAFLHLGTASRKAFSAGLHKDVPHDNIESPENIEERRITFWSLYMFETWFCFHVGRPSSLSLRDVAIEYPQDPFIRVLVYLCKTISRSMIEIYSERHESLLHMWRVARSIAEDLRAHEAHMKQALGFGLDGDLRTGSLGVQQTIYVTLYYHTVLLTFRPFLVFRGHWRRGMKIPPSQRSSRTPNRPNEIPSWLNEACNHTITAARKTIHHLCEASEKNDLVKELRYHGYFMGSSAFTLIYDLLNDPNAAPNYLPWVYASLQNLSTMRAGDPIQNTIGAIQTVLSNINPSYGWFPYANQPKEHSSQRDNMTAIPQVSVVPDTQDIQPKTSQDGNSLLGPLPDIPASQWNFPLEGPETGRSGGSSDDLLDFTQSDMGWNFDFSTMDLEAFFSVYPSAGP
ncbi:hypothetical protein N7450_002031 [Penicillium hetheringtonii]|uniref:Xylanolytic transcriptional activator regulatory domain-containing protein n=1 Tax=Penicillium hetheringtonii TaxID=911720 RepID=A0AAD6E5C3_9EURO|nr:hypothetical protein N7450_002031 [Penicillium hetheringtonii]